MGSTQLARHLGDAELLALRDGADADPRLRDHVAACPLCRDLLAAWQELSGHIRDAGPGQEMPFTVAASRSFCLEEPSLSDRMAGPTGPEPLEALPGLPADWLEAATATLEAAPAAADLGTLVVREHPDSGPRLEGPEGPLPAPWEPEPGVLPTGSDGGSSAAPGLTARGTGLGLAVRRAGLRVFLVVAGPGPGRSPAAGSGEVSLLPETGPGRVRRLAARGPAAGLAWLALPPGESELLVRLARSYRLRICRLAPEAGDAPPGV